MVTPATRVFVLLGLPYDPDVRVRRVTQSLAGAGYDVTILAWDRTAQLAQRATDGAVRVERIAIRSRRGRGVTQVFFFARVGLRMIRRLRVVRPDVIHAVDLPMLGVALAARPFVGGRRVRIVYDAFEIYERMVAHRFPRVILWLIGAFERRLPGRADLVITPGRSRQRYFEERGIESVAVPNWIDPPDTIPPRAAARRDMGIPDDRFCLAYAGALLASRDLESLLRHARRHPEDVVLIAGTGDREPWLRQEAAGLENVRFLGWLSDPSVLLVAADALFYALHSEHPYAALAAPNNLYVAIAYAVPLVYRPQGELAEVGRDHEIGAPFTDDPSMDAAVDSLRDPSAAAAVRAGLAALRVDYTWERAVAPLLAVYPEAVRAISSATPKGP